MRSDEIQVSDIATPVVSLPKELTIHSELKLKLVEKRRVVETMRRCLVLWS
jgi:hypothetical protein